MKNDHVNLEGWLVSQDMVNSPTQSAICRLMLALQTPTSQLCDKDRIKTIPYNSCAKVFQ